jgi:hypothetical protein
VLCGRYEEGLFCGSECSQHGDLGILVRRPIAVLEEPRGHDQAPEGLPRTDEVSVDVDVDVDVDVVARPGAAARHWRLEGLLSAERPRADPSRPSVVPGAGGPSDRTPHIEGRRAELSREDL